MVVAGVVHIRRTLQQIRADEQLPHRDQLLDTVDQLQLQLSMVNERLRAVERRLAPGEDEPPTDDAPRS